MPASAQQLGAIPDTVPPHTVLRIGDPKTQRALELSGDIKKLPFKVEWLNLSGGPRTIEAFRAKALDVGSVADIPPIHANWTNLPTKIVAVGFRKDAVNHPIYQLGIAPHAGIHKIQDLKGKKIAYSPGQAQGALVQRVLIKAGLRQDEVKLVEMPSTGDTYANALASGLVDAAPLGEAIQPRFIANYGKDGARLISHGLKDDPAYLYAPVEVLADPAKAAALREYVKFWARASRWVYEHPQQWVQGWFVENQGLDRQTGEILARSAGEPDIPDDWNEAIERQQETIDLLARVGNKPRLKAAGIFDRRFEHVAGQALKEP
ncbi:MAG: ABC transporter substrate-binding protein [Burkholderiaceae bacterium]|nr:ABC transporter substrate-binding protein [Burkholderiaceae bacterium]